MVFHCSSGCIDVAVLDHRGKLKIPSTFINKKQKLCIFFDNFCRQRVTTLYHNRSPDIISRSKPNRCRRVSDTRTTFTCILWCQFIQVSRFQPRSALSESNKSSDFKLGRLANHTCCRHFSFHQYNKQTKINSSAFIYVYHAFHNQLTLSLPDTLICVNYSTVYNDFLVVKGLN